MADQPQWPVPAGPSRIEPPRDVAGVIERVIADVPPPRTERVSDAARAALAVASSARSASSFFASATAYVRESMPDPTDP